MFKLYKKSCAIIQVDCDRDWQDVNISVDILKKLLNIFERYNIKATWFTVGMDLEYAAYRDFFAALVHKKHEIGNHTYSHRKNFSLLEYREKMYEIALCDKKIRELGFNPVGFRAPYFDADVTMFSILNELGYKYDSSICPSPYLPLCSVIKSIMNREQVGCIIANKKKQFNFSMNENGIREIPVSVFPVLRFPVHASYAMILPHKVAYKYTKTMINKFANLKKPLIYVLHLNDLCLPQHFVSREFRYFMPYEKRIDFIEQVCYWIRESFEIILSKDYEKE